MAEPLPVAEIVAQVLSLARVSFAEPTFRDVERATVVRIAQGAPAELAPLIDHTLLRADATGDELLGAAREAKHYGFATVCVSSASLPLVAAELAGSAVKAISVVGFPLGATASRSKAFEAKEAIADGAREIDMVIHQGALKAREYTRVLDDIRAVVEACAEVPVKVIIEAGALHRDEKIAACALSRAAGAAFVKTSTGFGPGGASVQDIALMREVVGPSLGVKASGGVRTVADARALLLAGASRLGASASVAIVTAAAAGTDAY